MAKVDYKFLDFHVNDDYIKTKVSVDLDREDLILIKGYDSDHGYFNIYLDKSTAIKFTKTLRTEINKIED